MSDLRTAAQQALEALETPIHEQSFMQKQNAITALRAALAQEQAEPVAWQRIETAPKTGRKVILFYLNRNNFPRTVMARWVTDDEAVETDTDCVGLEGGWYECIDNWDDYTEVAIHEGEPTHWMPLPPAPTSEETPKKEREQMLADFKAAEETK